MPQAASSLSRRRFLKTGFGGAAVAVVGAPRLARAAEKILIGYWPIASGLPLYVGLERDIFKEAGLDVEGARFASAQQVADAMVATAAARAR